MGEHTWPEEWFGWRDGDGCPKCVGGRFDEDDWGVRYFAGEYADAYLQRRPVQPGYSTVFFHRRHVADPIDLTDEEMAGYWADVRTVGHLVRTVFQPLHLNYQLLGNIVPHVHTHLVPRYADGPAPGHPLPETLWQTAPELGPADLEAQLTLLRAAATDH